MIDCRFLSVAVLWSLTAVSPLFAQTSEADPASQEVRNQASESSDLGGQPLLRHIVMFEFQPSSTEEEVQRVVDVFAALPNKIPEIAAFEFGKNNSPEGLSDGLTHCFTVTFLSEEDRATYLPHPAHKAFVKILKPHLKKVVVFDYWAGK